MSVYTGVLERAAGSATLASATLFAALSGIRGKRFFHPDGATCSGTLAFHETNLDLPFAGTSQARVRLSRGVGMPGSLPDVFGLAVKLGEDEHDFLLATSGDGPVTRHMLLPASGFFSLPYSSVLPYEIDGRLIVFGAVAADDDEGPNPASVTGIRALVAMRPVRFELTVAAVGAKSPQPFASLVVAGPDEREISFNPWSCRPPLRPAGPLNRLRLDTYKASQRARADRGESTHR